MRDTAFFASDPSRLTTAYRSGPGSRLEPYDGPTGAWSHPPAFEDGSGGLVSTVDDLLALARMLLRGGEPVLPADLAAAMCTDQLTDAQKVGAVGSIYLDDRSWGFGQAVSPTGAFGWDGGLGTTWLVDPNHDLTVIVLTQRAFDSPELPTIHADVQAAAYASLS
jgi:CubicO group peptidase (beta-lactamase class C family)